jgi:hypothetical protein
MTERTPQQENPAQPLEDIEQHSIKITKENLEEALRILRQVLDEEVHE